MPESVRITAPRSIAEALSGVGLSYVNEGDWVSLRWRGEVVIDRVLVSAGRHARIVNEDIGLDTWSRVDDLSPAAAAASTASAC